jgi:hypothetical protein
MAQRADFLREQLVWFGSWLCENARTLDGDRRSYSFKTVLVVKLASAFNLENELKNVILAVFFPRTSGACSASSVSSVRFCYLGLATFRGALVPYG